jgi:predicted dehydrogenase
MDRDPSFAVDRVTSMLLDFGDGRHATGTCATQTAAYQRVQIVGEAGRIEIPIPFNAPADRPCRILVDDGSDLGGAGIQTIEVAPADQYTIQGDRFARAILDGTDVAPALEDAVANMRAMDEIRTAVLR